MAAEYMMKVVGSVPTQISNALQLHNTMPQLAKTDLWITNHDNRILPTWTFKGGRGRNNYK